MPQHGQPAGAAGPEALAVRRFCRPTVGTAWCCATCLHRRLRRRLDPLQGQMCTWHRQVVERAAMLYMAIS